MTTFLLARFESTASHMLHITPRPKLQGPHIGKRIVSIHDQLIDIIQTTSHIPAAIPIIANNGLSLMQDLWS
jgi:uncharacterized protein with PQ loop repeat